MEFKALSVSWFDGLRLVKESGVWPDGLLDACMVTIPKAEGNATPLGQRPFSVLPIVYRLWATARLVWVPLLLGFLWCGLLVKLLVLYLWAFGVL